MGCNRCKAVGGLIAVLFFQINALSVAKADKLSSRVVIRTGVVNSAIIRGAKQTAVVYGASEDSPPKADWVLLPHHRRDVVWAAESLIENGSKVIAPEAERALIETPEQYWGEFQQKRFHDYAQQTTKVLARGIKVDRWISEGDTIDLGEVVLEVLETPGFTRGSVSYVARSEERTIVFSGDLIAGPGKLLDIYSYQDAIEEANIRGYHGYGGRFAALLASIEKVKALKPDVLVPARGEIIHRPIQALDKLSQRVKTLYRSYLSTSALNWYFKEERMGQCAERILGSQAEFSLMPYSSYEDTPDWIWVKGTSRLIISETGHSLLVDCGNTGVIDGVKELLEAGVVNKVDGIFVTHYHDDHTDAVQQASEEFDCPVFAVQNYVDILRNPGNYHMPCLHHTPIEEVVPKQHGDIMEFHEFKLTFRIFPGQTFYHGALLVEQPKQAPVFFVGDAFSPSGMDDYCVLNRNLMHKDDGFLFCLRQIRALGENYWLINEHIPHVFRFSKNELDTLERGFVKRIDTVRSLTVWDDPNYAVDEQWAVLYPYGLRGKSGMTHEFNVVITNHSSKRRDYDVQFRLPEGAELVSATRATKVSAGALAVVRAKIRLPEDSGHYLIRADIKSDGIDVRDWVESTVTVVADEK
ncbi:MAG: hypothetical protein CMM02_04565 [Rhodopirellula sp.]|nr:hypothetical protein [Rhodopirellula sp.]